MMMDIPRQFRHGIQQCIATKNLFGTYTTIIAIEMALDQSIFTVEYIFFTKQLVPIYPTVPNEKQGPKNNHCSPAYVAPNFASCCTIIITSAHYMRCAIRPHHLFLYKYYCCISYNHSFKFFFFITLDPVAQHMLNFPVTMQSKAMLLTTTVWPLMTTTVQCM